MFAVVYKYLVPKGFRGFTFISFVFLMDEKDKNQRFLIIKEVIFNSNWSS